MKLFLLVIALCSFGLCPGQTPVKADIDKAVKKSWEKPASSSGPQQTATIQEIRIGSGAKANEQDKIDGIPGNATVTMARVDFTVREFYSDRTIVTHRLMTAKVYKDQFVDWALKSNGMKILDSGTEPAKK